MKLIFRKFFCGEALKECLERESDLTMVIEDIIKENAISTRELKELNKQYSGEIDSLRSKIIILEKLLNKKGVKDQK